MGVPFILDVTPAPPGPLQLPPAAPAPPPPPPCLAGGCGAASPPGLPCAGLTGGVFPDPPEAVPLGEALYAEVAPPPEPPSCPAA